jgi:RNA polymerase sigma factor (sigma-70 family)
MLNFELGENAMTPRDRELLERWTSSKDAQAFDSLVTAYSALVYSACRRVLRDERAAEDMTQECFLQLAYKTPEIRTSLGAWLHKVATRQSLNEVRREMRLKRRERQYSEESKLSVELGWDDVQVFVDEAVEELPDELRIPVVASFLERKSHASIAKEMGLGRSTVSQRIDRGIHTLRDRLKEKGVTATSASLAAMLTANAVEAAPAGLAAVLGKIALAGEGVKVAKGLAGGSIFGGSPLLAGLAVSALLAVLAIGIWFSTVRVSPRSATSELVNKPPAIIEEPNERNEIATEGVGVISEEPNEEIEMDASGIGTGIVGTSGASAATQSTEVVTNSVQGRVYDSSTNVGIPNVVVDVYEAGDIERKVLSSNTAADGSFLMDGLTAGTYELIPAHVQAYPGTKQKGMKIEFEIVDVAFSPVIQDIEFTRGGTMTGYVYLGNEPMRNASLEVWSTPQEGILEPFTITTDSEGHYAATGLTDFRGTLQPRRTRPNGTSHNGLIILAAEVSSNKVTETNFEFIQGKASIAGTVFYENMDTPVQASIKVHFGWMQEGEYNEEQIFARTDENGYFVAEGLPPGEAEMHIRPSGVGGGIRRIETVYLNPGERLLKDVVISAVKVQAEVTNIPPGTVELFVVAHPGEREVKLESVADFMEIRDTMAAVQQYYPENTATNYSGLLKGLKPGTYTISASAWPASYDQGAIRAYGGFEKFFKDLRNVSKFVTISETDQDIEIDLELP